VATANTGIGPTNRWYRGAVAAATSYSVAPDLDVRAITPLYFAATKLEAFAGRGRGDYQASHDLEDVLQWANDHADQLDPLGRPYKLAMPLEPDLTSLGSPTGEPGR
jgi:predicted nucleotidyltransferase